ncbi:MAG: NnrU family protein [Proteobacteria bacterium]|nr:NnrU family protein [Pseudomonadota bacterium]
MLALSLGLLLFFATHLLTTRRTLRAGLIARFGAGPYKGLYTAASLAGFALFVYGFGAYRASGYVDVWDPPHAMTHVSFLLLLPVFPLLIATYRPGWIKAKARHPMLLAIKLWALAHLLVNGDLGSILLFGGFLLWAGYARATMRERELPEGAPPGSTRFGANDLIAIGGGILAYVVFAMWLHPILIGVPVAG